MLSFRRICEFNILHYKIQVYYKILQIQLFMFTFINGSLCHIVKIKLSDLLGKYKKSQAFFAVATKSATYYNIKDVLLKCKCLSISQ